MKLNSIKCLVALLFGLVSSANLWAASGPFVCNPSTPAYSAVYSPFAASVNVTAVTFTVFCSRTSPLGPASMAFNVKSFNGLNGLGTNNAKNAINNALLPYDLYTDATCSTPWKNTTYISGVLPMPSGQTSATSSPLTFYVCIPAAQVAVISGTFTDSVKLQIVNVTMTPAGTTESDTTSQVGVTINVAKECKLTAALGTINFGSYAAFGGAKNASAGFGTSCTNTATYTMALDATAGVVAGLNYSLVLSAVGATGNGMQQSFTINGTMAAGQAGSCAAGGCTGTVSNGHTLTITY
jgi:spore coat protein U-like protein